MLSGADAGFQKVPVSLQRGQGAWLRRQACKARSPAGFVLVGFWRDKCSQKKSLRGFMGGGAGLACLRWRREGPEQPLQFEGMGAGFEPRLYPPEPES